MKSSYIVITGFMGCGKTEVASRLATELKLPFIDLDEEVLRAEGRSAAELIIQEGEQAFRKIETAMLRRVFEVENEGVIALGGGAWIEKINRDIINKATGVTIWLDTPFEICWQRISSSEEVRPLGRTLARAQDLFDKRKPIYGLATIKVSPGDEESVDSISSRIRSALEETSTGPRKEEV